MDEARAVIERLERIELLERNGAPPGALLEELRGLVRDAEAWARIEGDPRAAAAVERCEWALVQCPRDTLTTGTGGARLGHSSGDDGEPEE